MEILNTITELLFLGGVAVYLVGCDPSNRAQKPANIEVEEAVGTYGYDLAFLKKNDVTVHELVNEATGARIMVVPQWQGRVMTSTADDLQGKSYGWINYDLITSKKEDPQFNPFGGEERFWMGPEGGPFSLYFGKGKEQEFSNWVVPSGLDTEAFDIVSAGDSSIVLKKDLSLENASGNLLEIDVRREVRLLREREVWEKLGVHPSSYPRTVAYQSTNTITNKGAVVWNENYGFVSIWLLSMFNPSADGVVFIPVKPGDPAELGKVMTDDYFGKVPQDRLKVVDDVIFFKVDGKLRSKIGISPQRATPFSGGYDPGSNTLTIVWYSQPMEAMPYVNSKWGPQQNPLDGDAVNSYNDGPTADGSVMGPFYEIESSSPAALLGQNEQMQHVQNVFHFQGDREVLDEITGAVFGLSTQEIISVFENDPGEEG